MRLAVWLVALLAAAPALAAPVRDLSRPLQPLATLEAGDLMGPWYEVARSPSLLEQDCAGVTTEFRPRAEDSRIELRIACHKGGPTGPLVAIEGIAAPVAPAVMLVRLVRLSQLGTLDLQVLHLDAAEGVAAIGAERGQIGWVLARDLAADPAAINRAIGVLVENGYDAAAIARVAH